MTAPRWAWTEVDLDAIAHNVGALRACAPSASRFMAVVKADGYGHGAEQVARRALSAGATDLGVATVAEGVALRRAGITAPLMLLSEPPDEAAGIVLEHRIVPTLFTHQFASAYSSVATVRGVEAPFHLKVDTGMNRIGVAFGDAVEFAVAVTHFPSLKLEGTLTHFATADVPNDWDAERQLKRFNTVIEGMRTERVDPGIVHAANSAATILYPGSHFDMVRCGIALYGLQPSKHTRGRVDLSAAMSVKARTTCVKTVGMGEGVSYGLTFRASSPATIATLPLGYADGVHRVLSNNMQVLLGGKRVTQVGRVCMDQFMVEVPRGMAADRGDEFVIVGSQGDERITMDELAENAGTINYELACAFGMRLERTYI